jgi:hypothetical protein
VPCFVERTGFTGGQATAAPSLAASGAGTMYSRGRGPSSNPIVTARQRDSQGRIAAPLDGSSNHITQYDPNSPYRVSWDMSADGDAQIHATNQSVPKGHPDRHEWPRRFGPGELSNVVDWRR